MISPQCHQYIGRLCHQCMRCLSHHAIKSLRCPQLSEFTMLSPALANSFVTCQKQNHFRPLKFQPKEQVPGCSIQRSSTTILSTSTNTALLAELTFLLLVSFVVSAEAPLLPSTECNAQQMQSAFCTCVVLSVLSEVGKGYPYAGRCHYGNLHHHESSPGC